MVTEQFQTHIAYTFDGDEKYLGLAVKTLIEARDELLLEARMISKNGKERIVFNTNSLSSYKTLEGEVPTYMLMSLLQDLGRVIKLVKDSPFWELTFIDLRKEHIYLDLEKKTVKFILIPRVFEDQRAALAYWEEELLKFVNDVVLALGECPELSQIKECLDVALDSNAGIERKSEIEKLIDILIEPLFFNEEESRDEQEVNKIILEYEGGLGHFKFVDAADEFVIGKSDECNGIVNISGAISRRHCVIQKTPECIQISDLGSTNGTWLNGEKLEPNNMHQIHAGDELKIADITFRIIFE
ncbi:FHA domain protein [Butyrivibrio sp. INlla18]|uniref:FHA domain-containing protein n=1 Tax=Butyrivibrio sp. INlla18 TaxID=1520806 RepID=UPI00088E023C|nr:FHA domain-containing protein [Butyrivibrio sp. INlla18]SDA60304.1 FHA domain protein [Butyrivibrio sp. INlla18]